MGSPILFGIVAVVAILSAVLMLRSTNAVHSALWLVLNFTAIAVLYIILNAPFIAMVQITVYAGAIMVLFLFVIMLLGTEELRGITTTFTWQRGIAGLLAIILVVAFAMALAGGDASATANIVDTSPARLGIRLFEAYAFPFEVTGALLLTAIIGVVILSKPKKGGKDA